VTSAALAEPSAVQANGAHESVTSAALAEPSAAQANGAHESVTSAALAEPSAAQANGAHESVTSAALAEPSAVQANGAHESVTPIALAEPSAVQANGAQVIHADIVRRWYGSDVTATLRTIAADRLRGDVIVMALDAPIATYRNGALAPELVTLARRCTMPSHTLRVTTPSATRTTVVYLVEMEHKRRLISMPISDAAERLCKSGVRVIEAMPYESYERYLNAAQRKRDAAKRGTAQRAKTRVNIAPAQASAVQESVTASAPSGKRAEPAHYTLTCAVCGHQFEAKRSHAQTCSAKCRKRLSRANGAE
jgi:predicted nuclease with RNAse H fold